MNIEIENKSVISYEIDKNKSAYNKPSQKKEVTPTKETQVITPDTDYELSQVTIKPIPNEYIKPTGTLEIRTNGEHDVKNYEKANVNIGGVKKGIIINSTDDDGYASEITIIGMAEIPSSYCNSTSTKTAQTSIGRLKKVVLDENVTKINSYAFGYQEKLVSINFPNSITEIGSYAFEYNYELVINSLPSNLQKIGEWCFTHSSTTELTIPSGVTAIPKSSFRNSSELTKVVCNGDITSIGSMAFYFDRNLITFALPNVTTVPTLEGTNAFTTTGISSGTGYIYVPDALVEDFKVATNWSTYANQIKGISEL